MAKKRKKQSQEKDEDIFVRLDPFDALEAKKELLEVTASLIKQQMLNSKVKEIGKRETRLRNNAKREIKSIGALLGRIITEMPKVKISNIDIRRAESMEPEAIKLKPSKISKEDKVKHSSLNQELLDIKRKLANLS